MNDKEKYGIELEANISPFKSALNSAFSYIKSLGKKMEEETTITPKVDINELYKQRDKIQKDLEKTQEALNWDFGKGQNEKYSQEYDSLIDKYNDINKQINNYEQNLKNVNDEQEELTTSGNSFGTSIGKVLEKSMAKIKRFTFYLLGARSVFTLFMRYQSIYYQYNEQMQYQSELSQNAIALSLAPAFELLGNVIAYASIGFARFIELLTGVNVLSKVSTKGIRDYNKSLKETQTLIAGVDEITNLTTPNSTGLASQYQALADFQDKIKEVDEWFEKNKWIQDLAKGLKAIWEWLEKKIFPSLKEIGRYVIDNWGVLKYLFGAVALTGVMINLGVKATGLSTTLGTLAKIAGGTAMTSAGTGLAGLASTLYGLSAIGAIALTIVALIKLVKEGKEEYDYIWSLAGEPDKETTLKFLLKLETDTQELSTLDKDTDEYKKKLDTVNQEWDAIKTSISGGNETLLEQKNRVINVGNELSNITNETYDINMELELGTKKAKEKGNNFWNEFGKSALSTTLKVGNAIATAVSPMTWANGISYGIARIKGAYLTGGYAEGLDYVPYDEYPAILHKGEAVVPAKYNPTIHSQGNEYTNSLLETLVEKFDDLSSRPNVFEIDGQKFATATYGLYRNEQSRNNYSKNVVVR